MLNWFNALVTAAVLLILSAAGADAAMNRPVDLLSLALAISCPLSLAILYKLASRRPRPEPQSMKPKRR